MKDKQAMVRVLGPSQLTSINTEFLNDFLVFREIFKAEHCFKRVVFWVEEGWGKTRVRKVKNLARAEKKDDELVMLLPGKIDLDLVRLAIASSYAGKLMTGIRWEVYRDFALTDLMEMGRFDVHNLIGDMDLSRIETVIRSGNIGISPDPWKWDFDALYLTHCCPNCQKVYGREVVMFYPLFLDCESCGFTAARYPGGNLDPDTLQKETFLFRDMFKKVVAALAMMVPDSTWIHLSKVKPNISLCIDPIVTPVICWGIKSGNDSLTHEQWENLYKSSIFPLLKVELFRSGFLNALRAAQEHAKQRMVESSLSHQLEEICEGYTENEIKKKEVEDAQVIQAVERLANSVENWIQSNKFMHDSQMSKDVEAMMEVTFDLIDFVRNTLTEQEKSCS